MRVWLVCALVALLAVTSVTAAKDSTPTVTVTTAGVLTVNGEPYSVKAIAYSPVPVGEVVDQIPFGDYFTPDYAYIWSRDLPAIAAAGFNTLRLYSWDNTKDHSAFLDTCAQFKLKVILTFYVPPAPAVWDAAAEQTVIDNFVTSVGILGDHPAILLWSFGNELNGPWNGYVTKFDEITDAEHPNGCGWQTGNNGGPCYNILTGDAAAGSTCFTATTCMYGRFYGWLNRAIVAAKAVTTRPMTSTFADVDYLVTGNPTTDRLPRFVDLIPDMGVIAVQLYRGKTFGNYFSQFASESGNKPLLIAEYGVDSFNDPCGWPGAERPCFNYPGQPNMKGGSDAATFTTGCGTTGADCNKPGEVPQSEWDVALLNEIKNGASNKVIGGVLMEWHDENWKNIGTQDSCKTPCAADPATIQAATDKVAPELAAQQQCIANPAPFQSGGANGCTASAHVHCPMHNAFFHGLCGYLLQSAPDSYVNEAWFGVNGVEDCGSSYTDQHGGHRLSALKPRPVLSAVATSFSGTSSAAKSCADMAACYNCVKAASDIETHSAPNVVNGGCNAACGLQLSGTGGTGGSSGGTNTGNNGSSGGTNNNGGTGSTGTNNNGGSGSGGDNTDGGNTNIGTGAASGLQLPLFVLAALAAFALLF